MRWRGMGKGRGEREELASLVFELRAADGPEFTQWKRRGDSQAAGLMCAMAQAYEREARRSGGLSGRDGATGLGMESL